MKIFGVTGWKNAGKTGLMERLVSEISARGISVSTIKHAHHSFDVDHPGKDSYRHRKAGANEVLLASRARVALMQEMRGASEPTLDHLLARLTPVDLVLVEGYKRDRHAKIEAFRAETGNPLIAAGDATIKAVASDTPMDLDIPVFDLNDTSVVADFILKQTGLSISASPDQNTPDLVPPPLKDDCFSLPANVHWTSVDEALEMLRARLTPRCKTEAVPVRLALGRILAVDVSAPRANPPSANTAVDGYGFASGALGKPPHVLELVDGRAAAGAPYAGTVPAGQAIRILTGASLPAGVDTVVLQEDVTLSETHVAFQGGLKPGSNTRKLGEDVQGGQIILPAGRCITPADLALLAATGVQEIACFEPLRVGVLSTGDEVVANGPAPHADMIYDANRPMLLAQLTAWGFEAIDLGCAPDNRLALASMLDGAAARCDAILTSGGASAGDEDHMSALLDETGSMQLWRIAIKPGRPLALGLWDGVPVFGLPGNPVAALVCTLVFARPALNVLAGAAWQIPQGVMVPTGFSKSKKAGRREYLRARLRGGVVEVFKSEGSGRISGLSWAEGLVELPDDAMDISPGTPLRYIAYTDF